MPYISKKFIESIQEESDVLDVIKKFVELKKSGANYKGSSPFTAEKTPSFMVSPAKQIWKCFSSGKGGNNAVSFLMETGMSFTESIEWLANTYAKDIVYDDSKEAKAYMEKVSKQEDLRPLLKATIKKYTESFKKLPKSHPAKKEVFEKRKYTEEVVDTYQIGFSPGNKFIYEILSEKGLTASGTDLGLISKGNDFYYNRVTYTVFDKNGAPVGISGRDLSEDSKVKWLNSRDTILYDKSKIWYGLNLAKFEIRNKGKVYVVEGYNDVISFHINGLLNTVAPCGTSIHDNQIAELKKYSDTVVFAMDGDKAGRSSTLKNIPRFLAEGFRTFVVNLPDCDPDDFTRLNKDEIKVSGIESVIQEKATPIDGFKVLLEQMIGKDEVEKSTISKNLCEIISKIEEEAILQIYVGWLKKESGLPQKTLETWIKKFIAERNRKETETLSLDYEYELPKGIEMTPELHRTIKNYQLFMAKEQIWIRKGEEPPYVFKSVSNFSIDIIQHMQDEKFPMKLVSIKNVHGHEKIFDVPSEHMNSQQQFDNAVTAHGNYLFTGSRPDFQKIRAFLFDRMGTGRKIDVLGWQPEGFWAWNNKITIPGKTSIDIDENGVFKFENTSYYVPSANRIYSNNPFKYEGQKKMMCIQPDFNFGQYSLQLKKVHREHSITALLFALATPFQDIVVNNIKNFPLMFLSGPPSTGKDQLAACAQGFFGVPQTGIGLASGVSTAKAQVREFAQFSNIIAQLSEYKRGDVRLDEMLKDLWDRRGYKRGNIDSHVGTESIPILSSVIITSNDFPDNDALLTRVIWEDMNVQNFTEEAVKNYEILEDMNKQMYSHFTDDLINSREIFKQRFKKSYRNARDMMNSLLPDAKSRIIGNFSVLVATYEIFQDVVSLPFNKSEMLEHFKNRIEALERKLATASLLSKWWDCFLASLRGHKDDRLKVGHDLKLEGTHLYFNFTNCYLKIQRQWYIQYRESAPSKSSMQEQIKKDESFIDYKNGIRMEPGRQAKSTSAYVVDLAIFSKDIAEEITDAVDFQMNEGTIFDQTPVTPNNQLSIEGLEKEDLPF
ncbi:hypothetical protein I215_01803 [Galbibacter marinus]|uniref:Toprim domain-containing protein n=1 Tax=Galbibacter marinus TaxID=555500 RepID=K2QN11_9FLAO|nr:DNA primase [Galbibacter marinus]EKF56217.1 hypothetical protein I215_01803 [Galbibacter marinus]